MPRGAVSVIIPCFNRENYIGDAIDSALRQGPDIEVVVIDDGSTDNSWSVIASYGPRVKREKQQNLGASAARNRGIRLAKGRWIQFLDSDDQIPDGSTAAVTSAASKLGPLAIALSAIVYTDEVGELTKYVETTPLAGPISSELLLSAFIGTPQPLFPASALRDVNYFDERFRNHEDHELVTRLLARGYSFVGTGLVSCEARVHAGQRLSQDRSGNRFRHRTDVLRTITRNILEANLGSSALSVHARLLWSVAREAAREGQRNEAQELFQLARQIAGSAAINGRIPVRIAQDLLSPYLVERVSEGLKSIAKRFGNADQKDC